MMILSLVRNYLPFYEWALKGGWNIADCVEHSYDLEGMPLLAVLYNEGRERVGFRARGQV
jgi:formate dehydrogenase